MSAFMMMNPHEVHIILVDGSDQAMRLNRTRTAHRRKSGRTETQMSAPTESMSAATSQESRVKGPRAKSQGGWQRESLPNGICKAVERAPGSFVRSENAYPQRGRELAGVLRPSQKVRKARGACTSKTPPGPMCWLDNRLAKMVPFFPCFFED